MYACFLPSVQLLTYIKIMVTEGIFVHIGCDYIGTY